MKLSIVVPIGKFPLFIYATLANITETCGYDNPDIVLLLTQDLLKDVIEHLYIASKKYHFRIIVAPFNLTGSTGGHPTEEHVNHLKLLDWAVRHGELEDYVVIQHCDLFYHPSSRGWYSHFIENLSPELLCLYLAPHALDGVFMLDGRPIPIIDDFLSVFNRKVLIETDLSFNWGKINEDIAFSDETNRFLQAGRFVHHQTGVIGNGYWFDGTKAMSFEVAARFPQKAKPFNWDVHHLLGFFKIAEAIEHKDGFIHINKEGVSYNLLYRYALITSECFDVVSHEKYIVPIAALGINQRLIDHNKYWTNYLKQYSNTTNIAGETDRLGIKGIVLNNKLL